MAPLFPPSHPVLDAPRRIGRSGRAWLALLGWALLTLGAPTVTGAQLLERARASDDGAGLVWASDDAVEPAAIPAREVRSPGPALPPPERPLAGFVLASTDAIPFARPVDGLDVPTCRGVARWCLARATSTAHA